MRFSELLASVVPADDSWVVTVPEDWMQGRSVFGGLQSALALHVMRARMRGASVGELPLRVLQTTFVAPMTGAATRIDARVLRVGKSTAHVEARISAGAELVAIVVGVFGAGRPSEVHVSPRQPAVAIEAAPGHRAPTGSLPAFLQHFALRWRRGAPPGAGSTETSSVVDASFRDAGRVTEEHVVALADAVPPHALSMLMRSAAGSSLTWTLEMLRAGDVGGLGLDDWRLDVELLAADAGYTSQSVMVWGPDGRAVALSRQCMVVFG
jgi:acyl-CoA thioesterase